MKTSLCALSIALVLSLAGCGGLLSYVVGRAIIGDEINVLPEPPPNPRPAVTDGGVK